MFLSKSIITLFSSIGASSVPLVSVLALYKIKSSSHGNHLESASSNTNEENVIDEKTAAQLEDKESEEQTDDTKTKSLSVISSHEPTFPITSTDTAHQSSEKKRENKSEVISITNIKVNSPKRDTDNPLDLTDPQKLSKYISDLFKKAEETGKDQDDKNISQKINFFVNLLTAKLTEINDQSEKQEATKIINALNTLKIKTAN